MTRRWIICCSGNMVTSICYQQMSNVSGAEFTSEQLSDLEAAAFDLIDSMPKEYRDSFVVLNYGFYLHQRSMEQGVEEAWQEVMQQADSISPYYLLLGRVPGQEWDVKLEMRMPDELFGCYESSYLLRMEFEMKRRLQPRPSAANIIAALEYLAGQVAQAKECCMGPTNFVSNECVTCAWTQETVVEFLQVEGFDQVEEIETDGPILSEPDCVCDSDPANIYQQTCIGTNCVEKQVGLEDFKINQNDYSIDTLYSGLERIATYFDGLGVHFYGGITDDRMFCAEEESSLVNSEGANKEFHHFRSQYDAAQVAFWFHITVTDGEERLMIRQKGFEGDVLECCCELIPGDCRANPMPVCDYFLEKEEHYEAVCLDKNPPQMSQAIFKENSNQLFGFDNNKIISYPTYNTSLGEGIPWKSLGVGVADQVNVEISESLVLSDLSYVPTGVDIIGSTVPQNYNETITIIGNSLTEDAKIEVKDINGITIGGLMVKVLPAKSMILNLVLMKLPEDPVYSNVNFTVSELENVLNECFKQINMTWTVNQIDQYEYDFDTNGNNSMDASSNEDYSCLIHLQQIDLQEFEARFYPPAGSLRDKTSTYFLYKTIASSSSGQTNGWTRQNEIYGAIDCDYQHSKRTLAHENGHRIGYEHPWDEFLEYKKFDDVNALMDYVNLLTGYKIRAYQW